MQATYNYAVKYQVKAECLSPLRTGSASGGVDQVLCRPDGTPTIQGSSLAGVMRSWTEKHYDDKVVREIFGSSEGRGSIIVSDAVFNRNTPVYTRPRLAIDTETGASKGSHKFDMANVAAGSSFDFSVIWTNNIELRDKDACPMSKICDILENIFAAITLGDIRFGAQKSNGFGRVKLKVSKAEYDMQDSKDLEKWADESKEGTAVELERRNITREDCIVFTVSAATDSLLVKAGFSNHEKKGQWEANIKERRLENGEWVDKNIIPASSIKGAVRARVYSLAEHFNIERSELDCVFGNIKGNKKADGKDGDKDCAGRVYFSDAQIENDKITETTRIRIERVSAAVAYKALFPQSPLSAEKIKFTIQVPASETKAAAMILYALRDLGIGACTLGSGYAVGRGRIDIRSILITNYDKRAEIKFADYEIKDCENKTWIKELLGSLEVKA